MSNTILHPTDFSECSMAALDYTIQLAKIYECNILLVHSFDFSEVNGYNESAQSILTKFKEIEKNAEQRLQEVGNKVVQNGIGCKAELYSGRLSSWLPELIENIKPKLVVMGTTGAGSISNKVFGSNTYSIIKSSNSPVIAVPLSSNYRGIKKIMIGVDLKTVNKEVINYISHFSRLFEANLQIVYVQPKEKKELGNTLIEKFEVNINQNNESVEYKLVIDDNYIDGLSNHMVIYNPDIFALVKSNKNFLDKLLVGSFSEKMIHNSYIPLLVIPPDIKF